MPKKKEVIAEESPKQEPSKAELQKLAREAVDKGVYSQTFGKNAK